jgi:hypothetical protein
MLSSYSISSGTLPQLFTKYVFNTTFQLILGDDILYFNNKVFLTALISLCFLSGCSKEKVLETVSPTTIAESESLINDYRKNIFFAPYTGEIVDEKTSKNIAVMAIIENSNDARPQSGLIDADIVYETMAEGGIPRFIALFQKNTPSRIGPIRSARPYFINIAREYNLPFGHCGYSDEAKAMIEKNKLMSINEFFFTGFYWRDRERKAPHNLYTSAKRLRDAASSRGYIKETKTKLNFNKGFWESDSHSIASSLNLKLNKYYSTSYIYKNGKYYKSMNNINSLNKEDNKPIAVSNIVVQATSIKLQPDNLHLEVSLTGEGTGYVLSNGKYTKMKWTKKDITSPTILTDENGLNIPFSPGNTWWHIIDNSNAVQIK